MLALSWRPNTCEWSLRGKDLMWLMHSWGLREEGGGREGGGRNGGWEEEEVKEEGGGR